MLAELALLVSLYSDPQLDDAISKQVKSYKKNGYVQHSFDRIAEYENYIQEAARKTGLAPCLIKGLIAVESEGHLDRCSRKSACGPAQFTKATARKYGIKINSWEDWRFDPTSIPKAADLLKKLIQKYGLVKGIKAYNYSEKKLRKLSKTWSEACYDVPEETCNFPVRVLAVEKICQQQKPGRYKIEPIFAKRRLTEVKKGHTLWSFARDVARKYGMPTKRAYRLLIKLNPQLLDIDDIRPGQQIWLPDF